MRRPTDQSRSELMPFENDCLLVVLMGVAGSGKTTIGRLVATGLGVPFFDGDDFHSAGNIDGMRRGIPLDDQTRAPWLERLRDLLDEHRDAGAVLACSALTPAYRTQLTDGLDVHFVALVVSPEILVRRLKQRRDHFVGTDLLASQVATLELSADLLRIDGDGPPDDVAAAVLDALASVKR